MKNKIFFSESYLKLLFFDCVSWIVMLDSWENLRKESRSIYKLIKIIRVKYNEKHNTRSK